ncbi:MAG: helix-turn-helix domain-containing protein [Actinomycetota bacterium]|nr:helix-turn-helix domain-containing protein [Actinomycetota bacterium]
MTAIETADGTLGLPEAADRLGVHRATVNDMVRSGRLPAHRDGAHWRIDRAVFEEFASTYVKPPNAPARRPRGMPTSTPALFELLREFGSASAEELAPLLDLHDGNVRKHLRLLEHQGHVRRRPDGEWELSTSA